METKKWYVGQTVWDKTVSDEAGEIKEIENIGANPIIVEFNGEAFVYTVNGRLFNANKYNTLSTTPYEIKMEGFSQEVEEELPNKGKVCWGRRQKSIWFIGHFIGKEDGEYILSPDIEGINSKYYDELTTKNPYDNSAVSILENTDREPQIGDICFFWDEDEPSRMVYCGELGTIDSDDQYPYTIKNQDSYKHCSLKNPLIE